MIQHPGTSAHIAEHDRSLEDAVLKITRVLRDPAEQASVESHLAQRAQFSIERFMEGTRDAVNGFERHVVRHEAIA